MNIFVPWEGAVSELSFLHVGLLILIHGALRCLILNGAVYLWATKSTAALKRRVYLIPLKDGQLRRELRSLLRTVLLDAIVLTAMVKSNLAFVNESNVLSTVVFSFFWVELWFYFAHRALHTRLLYPIHKLHHMSMVTSSLTSMTFSIAERLVFVVGFATGLWLFSFIHPISMVGAGIYVAFTYFFNLIGHTNIEIYPPNARWLISWLCTPTHHSLHHARVVGNYGLHTRWLDRLFGTEFADYEEIQKAAYNGQGLVRLSQRLLSSQDVAAAHVVPPTPIWADGATRRRLKRNPLHCECRLEYGDVDLYGRTLDLNALGAGVLINASLEVGDDVTFVVYHEASQQNVKMRAVVINWSPVGNGQTKRYGLRFVGLERRAVRRMKTFVRSTIGRDLYLS